jgi:hypothetical protein
MKYFRFDDICLNTNMHDCNEIAAAIHEHLPECTILYCISPIVNKMPEDDYVTSQRIFPKIFNAYSDYRIFYHLDKCGIPENIPDFVTKASHGLVHVDHRLLAKEAQEMSILVSCALSQSKIFVPPFNKWDKNTEMICEEHNIKLVKFEDGWLCAEYNEFDPSHDLWYIHNRAFKPKEFKEWLTNI